MLPFDQKPAAKSGKSWNDAVRHYNLPRNGIEVVILGDYKPRTETRQPYAQCKAKLCKKTQVARLHASAANLVGLSHFWRNRSLRYLATRSALVVFGLAMLGNIPVYSMIHPADNGKLPLLTELDTAASPAQILKELSLPAVAVESYSGYAVEALPDAQQGNWTMRPVTEGDDLDGLLSQLDLGKTARKLQHDAAIGKELEKLLPGSRLLVQIVEGRLLQLIYAKSHNETYIVSATNDDGYTGKWEQNAFEMRNSRAAFSITHSIPHDGKAAGLSKSLIRQLTEVFDKDTNFKKVRVGDRFGVIFEDYRYQGESIYTDKVLAAEYRTRDKAYQRIRYTLADGKTRYFSPNADTELKREAFDRQPIAGGRMSSGFGMRRHPVFGFFKSHTGMDFAAPRGTPIHATADGMVRFAGRQSGYGNVVELRHNDGVSTLYGHMSGFRDDLKAGDSIKRGDVIGYVGSTGTSTGNHVHYEYRFNGIPQDPAAVTLPTIGLMDKEEARGFRTYASDMMQQLDDLRKLASLSKAVQEASDGG